EVGVLELHDDDAGGEAALRQALGDAGGVREERPRDGLPRREVLLVRALGADRLRVAIGDDLARVVSARERAHLGPPRAEHALERLRIGAREVPERAVAEPPE